jgi:hypothetical protein
MQKLILGMGLLSAIAAYSAFGADLPYADKDFACTPLAKADKYLRDFKVDLTSFGGKELCNADVDTKKLLNDFEIIEGTQFAADAQHKFIRGVVPANNYYNWLKSQTRGVERGNDIPSATAYNMMGYFTMQDGWAKLTTLGRVGTIIHEGRHTAGYRHVPCDHGPYALSTSDACDTTLDYGGSHGVEMEYYARVVLQSKNLHPVYKSMARLMLLGRSNFVFNEDVLAKREGVVLVDADARSPWLYADGKLVEREAPQGFADNAALKRTSFGASYFAGLEAMAIDLYTSLKNGVNLKDNYSYYKLYQLPRPNQPDNVLDAEEVDSGTVRYFYSLSREGKLSSYNYPEGEWFPAFAGVANARRFITTTPDGRQGLFVVNEAGAIYPVDLTNRRLGAPLSAQWNGEFLAFAKKGKDLLMLAKNGTVYTMGEKGLEPEASLAGHRFSQMVNVPLYDSFHVEE